MAGELVLELGMLALSLLALIKGSDWFVDAAEKIGLSLGISPFIIGVTIIAFGTSLPELASGIAAVLNGSSEIVTGVVVGSNITNILLVLGLVAAYGKVIKMDYDIMDVDMPLLVASAFFLWLCLQDYVLSLTEAILFVVALVIFLVNTLTSGDKVKNLNIKAGWKDYLLLVVGGVLVSFGADFTVEAIGNISNSFEIDQDIIAQTLLALGTSLPEIVVSITAARKGKAALAVGNVLGSNIFNTYAVMAIPSFFGPLVIPEGTLHFTLPVMLVATLVFALMTIGGRITKWEGFMLLIFYVYFFQHALQTALH
ncbi:MAG: calcium/sodium antiporter [Saprospiraceae bacterium]|nr:calcium/sodium antiporter [Saprospiraceae bacterium]